jgi:hypothetical protein
VREHPFFLRDEDGEGNVWPRNLHELPPPQHAEDGESPRFRAGKGDLVWPCPSCESFRTEQRYIARRICSATGAAAGATTGAVAVLSGAESGAVIGALVGPIGAICGGVAGAVLAGLIAGAAGCATGAAFGEAIDLKVLNNWRCLACGRTFSIRPD